MSETNGITASGKIKINFKLIDGGAAIRALLKSAIHMFGTHDTSGLVDALSDFSASFGVSYESWLAYKLYITAMEKAIASTVETVGVINVVPDTGIVDRIKEQLPETFEFDQSSLDTPWDTKFYQNIEACLIECLGNDEQAQQIVKARLENEFIKKLQAEWRDHQRKYQQLCDYLNTPFDDAGEQADLWAAYNKFLREKVEEPIFGENYGLSAIYTPLNAYYIKPQVDSNKSRQESDIQQRAVVELATVLDAWLISGIRGDTCRAISGEPGSGKSTVAKMFAVRHADTMHVVYIPLDELSVSDNFRDSFEAFAKAKKLPDKLLESKRKLLIILDGLDELTEQGKAVAQTAHDFVQRVLREIDSINSTDEHIHVLFTGRVPAMQEAAGLFDKKSEQILHLLPYYNQAEHGGSECYTYYNPKGLIKHDYRPDWWKNYSRAAGKPVEMPSELLEKTMDDLTSSPLLLHLIALYYAEKCKLPKNRAQLYTELLEGVYNRAPRSTSSNRSPLSKRIDNVDEYMDILSDVAVSMWHSASRKVTLADVRKYCYKNKHGTLLTKLSTTMSNDEGIANIFMMFYGRKASIGGNAEMFEFTHKSFGEFLVARRIVAMLGQISKKLTEDDWSFQDPQALQAWTSLCGPTALDQAQFDFISAQVSLETRDEEEAFAFQETLCRLIGHVAREGMPFGEDRPQTFSEELRVACNAEIALMAAHSACAKITKRCSRIDWGKNSTTANAWLKRLDSSPTGKLHKQFLDHIQWQNQSFDGYSLRGANLAGAMIFGKEIHHEPIGRFGGKDLWWLVLKTEDSRILLLALDCVTAREYHNKRVTISWEKCDLREWLNGQFFEYTFRHEEEQRILSVPIHTNDNPKYGTSGGNDTEDKVFLLSIEEVCDCFNIIIDDNKVEESLVARLNGDTWWWWLRSPGRNGDRAASVSDDGNLGVRGDNVNFAEGGVRPALWLNLQS